MASEKVVVQHAKEYSQNFCPSVRNIKSEGLGVESRSQSGWKNYVLMSAFDVSVLLKAITSI